MEYGKPIAERPKPDKPPLGNPNGRPKLAQPNDALAITKWQNNKTRVRVKCLFGDSFIGIIVFVARFSIEFATDEGTVVIFKHAMASVQEEK